MLDLFLILTSVLLLAIVALLGFVGCYQNVTYIPPALMHVQTAVELRPLTPTRLLLTRSRSRAAS
jgi:hypothetical protein